MARVRLRASEQGNICCGHKMFLKEIRNIFCVSDTNVVYATNVACAGKRENLCVRNRILVCHHHNKQYEKVYKGVGTMISKGLVSWKIVKYTDQVSFKIDKRFGNCRNVDRISVRLIQINLYGFYPLTVNL